MLGQVLKFKALGTVWQISTKFRIPKALEQELRKAIEEFEQNYSRFRPDSKLSLLNNQKTLKDASPEMIEMLQFALKLNRLSKGIFNPSVGAELEKRGYGQPWVAESALSNQLSKDLQIDGTTIKLNSKIRLDFGGFGKGWLVDKVHDFLVAAQIPAHIINAGGDLYVGSELEEVYLEHPHDPKMSIGSLKLKSTGFSTSSKLKRTWLSSSGRLESHVINPLSLNADSSNMLGGGASKQKNNLPIQTSCLAENCLYSDVCATLLLLASPEDLTDVLHELKVQYLIIFEDLTFALSPNLNLS